MDEVKSGIEEPRRCGNCRWGLREEGSTELDAGICIWGPPGVLDTPKQQEMTGAGILRPTRAWVVQTMTVNRPVSLSGEGCGKWEAPVEGAEPHFCGECGHQRFSLGLRPGQGRCMGAPPAVILALSADGQMGVTTTYREVPPRWPACHCFEKVRDLPPEN